MGQPFLGLSLLSCSDSDIGRAVFVAADKENKIVAGEFLC
jgi:hypothetical protein